MDTPFIASSASAEEKAWEDEKQSNPVPSRQSFKRTPVPLHHGVGFGAEAIVSHSIKVARKKSVEKEARIKKLLSAPIPSKKDGSSWPENPMPTAHSAYNSLPAENLREKRSMGVKQYTAPAENNVPDSSSFSGTLRIKGFVSGLTDAVLFSTCLLIALFIKFSYFGENIWAWSQIVGTYLAETIAFPEALLLSAGVMVMGIAILLTSTIQMFFGFFLGVSGGQYSMGIRPSGNKNKLIQGFSIFISSFLSLGFILSSLWFLIFPGKLPFIPWYTLENDE